MISLLTSTITYANTHTVSGKVVDAKTGAPIAGAFITFGDAMVQSDESGAFVATGSRASVGVRAWGYDRIELPITAPAGMQNTEIRLLPLAPKSLYLSFWGVASKTLSQGVLDLIETTEVNALVIDVKGDRAMVAHRSAVPLATQVGAQRAITMPDMKGLISTFKAKGIYTIARIVVFKDELLAAARPALAIRTTNGEIYRDKENLMWVDPHHREVWEYNIAIAMEAAAAGFDEIQFDYVRFPDTTGLVFAKPNNEANRVGTIAGFLGEARKRLYPHNVYLSADVFGYLCWMKGDLQIGQTLESIGAEVDYLSPMLYPSGFGEGIPGARNPVALPYDIIYRSLVQARERTGFAPVRFRPWLQAFRDYAFDRRQFTATEIRAQIRAADEFGTNGWLLWNPRNTYRADGLRSRNPIAVR
ncbi:MAG: putative glycoside hydrolase [Burkholderiales bacterium]